MVLTNPPFGRKSSVTIVNDEGKADRESLVYERNDFWAATSNKQLNFVQHVKTSLKINGERPSSCRTTSCSRAEQARHTQEAAARMRCATHC